MEGLPIFKSFREKFRNTPLLTLHPKKITKKTKLKKFLHFIPETIARLMHYEEVLRIEKNLKNVNHQRKRFILPIFSTFLWSWIKVRINSRVICNWKMILFLIFIIFHEPHRSFTLDRMRFFSVVMTLIAINFRLK